MRTIKFRGKTTANGHWVYGCLINYDDNVISISNRKSNPWVDPATIGQFTGLTDRNGKEIYEGDIISLRGYVAEVRWNNNICAFCIRFSFESELGTSPLGSWIDSRRRCRVIGNIHDNPELMKGGAE